VCRFFIGLTHINAQQSPLPRFAPAPEEMAKRYERANERDSLVRRSVFKTSVTPGWSGASSFWYRNALPDSQSEFHFVDLEKKEKRLLFDHEKMSKALLVVLEKPAQASRLPITDVYVYPDRNQVAIATGKLFYNVNLADYQLTKIDELPADKAVYPGLTRGVSRWQRARGERKSPDQKWSFLIRDNNIYLEPSTGGDAVALTTDGTLQRCHMEMLAGRRIAVFLSGTG
jgi:hypothetical protein